MPPGHRTPTWTWSFKTNSDSWIATRVNANTQSVDVNLSFLAPGFKNGIDWLGQQPTFWNYPLLWEQFCWTWGGFLLIDDLKAEYDQLCISSGVPADEVPNALTAFDKFFPTSNSWFIVPGPTNAKRLILFPFHFHGIGAFRRFLHGKSKTVSAHGDHTLDDLIRWNNVTVALLQD